MKFFIDLTHICDSEYIREQIPTMPIPALYADKNLVLISKSASFVSNFKKLRLGSRLSPLFDEEHLERISNIAYGEMAYCVVNIGGTDHGVNIIGGNDFYLLLFHPISTEFMGNLQSLYGDMPGDGLLLGNSFSDFQERITRGCSFATANTLTEVFQHFSQPKSMHVFNVSYAMRALSNGLNVALSESISANFDISPSVGFGSSEDFVMALAATVFIFLGAGQEIALECEEKDGFAHCRIVLEKGERDRLLTSQDMEECCNWFYLVKLLAEGNLWEVKSETCKNGCDCITFKIPFTEEFGGCCLADISAERVAEILTVFF